MNIALLDHVGVEVPEEVRLFQSDHDGTIQVLEPVNGLALEITKVGRCFWFHDALVESGRARRIGVEIHPDPERAGQALVEWLGGALFALQVTGS